MVSRLDAGWSAGTWGFQLYLEFFLEILLAVAGIALELLGWGHAKWVNIGYLAVAGSLWLIEAIRWHSDPFFGVLLIMSLGMLILTGFTGMVYRWTQTSGALLIPNPVPRSLRERG